MVDESQCLTQRTPHNKHHCQTNNSIFTVHVHIEGKVYVGCPHILMNKMHTYPNVFTKRILHNKAYPPLQYPPLQCVPLSQSIPPITKCTPYYKVSPLLQCNLYYNAHPLSQIIHPITKHTPCHKLYTLLQEVWILLLNVSPKYEISNFDTDHTLYSYLLAELLSVTGSIYPWNLTAYWGLEA